MEMPDKLVLFHLDEQRYAIDLAVVERCIRIVEITPVPKASSVVLGVINMSGQIIPVVNTRTLLGVPDREAGLNDHLLIALASGYKVALLMDEVTGVMDFDMKKFIASEDIFPGIGQVEGAVMLEDGITFICDLYRFISREDLAALGNDLADNTRQRTDARDRVFEND